MVACYFSSGSLRGGDLNPGPLGMSTIQAVLNRPSWSLSMRRGCLRRHSNNWMTEAPLPEGSSPHQASDSIHYGLGSVFVPGLNSTAAQVTESLFLNPDIPGKCPPGKDTLPSPFGMEERTESFPFLSLLG